jgi:hypothetical protein
VLLTLSAEEVHLYNYGPPIEFGMIRSNVERWLPALPLSYRDDVGAIGPVACLTAGISKCPIKIARIEVGIDCGSGLVGRRPSRPHAASSNIIPIAYTLIALVIISTARH